MSGYSVADLPARMQAKIAVGDTGCWLWTASKNKGGYGQVGVAAGKPALAHRVAYQTLVGPIPEGLELDHLCRVRNCCNPDHLEPVTRQENARRGLRNGFALQTHCLRGHPLTGDNLRIVRTYCGTGRVCRECARVRDRIYRERRKATQPV